MENKIPIPSVFTGTPKVNQKPSSQFGPSYTFKLRQYKEGNFSGLWELTLIDRLGKVQKMISDADALTYCLENLQGELENDGF